MPGKPSPQVIAAAQAAEKKWGIPASISIAQFALESAWGTHTPPNSLNFWGMKAISGQPYVTAQTREVINGKSVYIQAKFRSFSSFEESFDEHAQLLATGKYYARARAVLPDVEKFANALTGVYATDPRYGQSLMAVIRSGNLTQYDAKKPSPLRPGAPQAAALGAVGTTIVAATAATQVTWSGFTVLAVATGAALVLALAAVVGVILLLRRVIKMSAATDSLNTNVSALETARDSIIAEINTLKAGTDEAAVQAASDRVAAVVTSLQAAIAPPAA